MDGARVVVLGGGFGGAAAALEARRLLGDEHRVTLVDRSRVSHLCGANPLVMTGVKGEEGVARSLEVVEAAGVELVTAEVQGLDLDAARVETTAGPLGFDQLVVALGVRYDWESLPGAADAHSFYEREATLRLRRRLEDLDRGRVVIGVAGTPYRCPPAPIEAALLVDSSLRRKGARGRCDIHLAIPEPKPLGVAGPEASSRVSGMLEERGISLHPGVLVTEVVEGGSAVALSDGSQVEAEVAVVVPTHRVPPIVADAGLAEAGGWARVDRSTLETAREGVFAVGDVNSVPIPPDKALPKAGVFAAGQGRVAARVIAARLGAVEPPPPYDGVGHCLIAFSPEEAAEVGGAFLAEGGPQVGLGQVTGLALKERWEQEWASFRI